ncbi:Gag-Pol polyprotein [Gossypium australe]|uniref:Gag-Pol polyprotein n=1 Tax=Gossypium australe TaxID=47621 RepID=A0A5B6WES0_9ROSI|nr:Gag-Pol polyprotein [Gossypium australe]
MLYERERKRHPQTSSLVFLLFLILTSRFNSFLCMCESSMDWLTLHNAIVNCKRKSIELRSHNGEIV